MLKKIFSKTIRSSFLTSLLLLSLILSINNIYISNDIPVVSGDSSNSGFNFFDDAYFIVFVEDGTWKDVDVSGYIPEGSSGVILDILNADSFGESVWVRKKGSTDDHYFDIQSDCHKYAYVGVDENRVFQARAESSDIAIWLIGYTDSDSVVLFDNGIDYALGVTGSYQDIDASADLPEGATGVIIYVLTDTAYFDIRHPDSTDAVTGYLFAPNNFPQFAFCGVNSSRMFQGQISTTDVDFYIIGYTKGSAITWKVNMDDVSLTIYDSWEDIDVTSETTVDATGVILRYRSTSGSHLEASSRIDGSTDDRHTESQLVALEWSFAGCGLATGEIFEGYADQSAIDHYVIGYCEEVLGGGSGNVIYPDHVEYSIGVTNATHTLDNNNTYAEMDFDAVIIWDFGELVENVTSIRWELTHSTSGAMWRVEASPNLYDDWYPVAQTQQSDGNPPSDSNDSTRYDSETSGRFRYLKMLAVRTVLHDWYLDYICVIVQPPSISYDDGTYQYATYLEYYNWEVRGTWGGDVNYASRPFNMLGKNMTTGSDDFNASQVNWLVTEDDDPDNYAVLKFDDFYNITSAEVKTEVSPSNQHAYFYVSQYPDSGWVLIWDSVGNEQLDWYGDNVTLNYIRYAKMRCTGTPNNHMRIDAVRLKGVLSAGSPPEEEEEDVDILPSFSDLPTWFGLVLGIDVFGAGIFLSGIILMMFLLPIVWYGKSSLAVMIVGVVLVGFLVTITWLPTWIILVIILLIAGMYASKVADWLSPSSKR